MDVSISVGLGSAVLGWESPAIGCSNVVVTMVAL